MEKCPFGVFRTAYSNNPLTSFERESYFWKLQFKNTFDFETYLKTQIHNISTLLNPLKTFQSYSCDLSFCRPQEVYWITILCHRPNHVNRGVSWYRWILLELFVLFSFDVKGFHGVFKVHYIPSSLSDQYYWCCVWLWNDGLQNYVPSNNDKKVSNMTALDLQLNQAFIQLNISFRLHCFVSSDINLTILSSSYGKRCRLG